MAKKKKKAQPAGSKKKKTDMRRVVTCVVAIALALVFLLPLLAQIAGGARAVTQSEIDALIADQKASQQRQDELEEQLAAIKGRQDAAAQQVSLLGQQLSAIDQELATITQQIALYDQQIAEKEEQRLEAVAREEAQYDLFCRRVRVMEEDGNVSYWSCLFGASSFTDLLDRLTIVNDVMDYDHAVMDQLIATRQEIETIKAELEAARTEQEGKRQEEQEKRDQQAAKVQEAQSILNEIKSDAAKVNELLDQEHAAEAKVDAEIKRKQQQLEAQRRAQNVTIDSESSYMWPLPGHYRLTSAFGYRIHPITGRPHSHTGIDIPASRGTAILACKSGQVVTSAYHYSYGNYVVIDHGSGNSTLYAHMSSRAVSEGQMVTQGQTVGYVGSTGSSTGNHLHLEVRVNYARIDPESKFTGLSFDRAYNR